ncbi:MAG: nodulation protein NfeD [Nitrococcus mobilis]|nr:nodulation protein NfeD [Nitrococcus mobilis]
MRAIVLASLLGLLVAATATVAANERALLLRIDGAIGPAISDYITTELTRAEQQDAALVILEMDTPGGLDTSMRDIIQAILSSSVPVVSYVAPSGSRAASAGTYILYASHVAAMAPGTNLGAATPVQIGGMPSAPSPRPDKEPGKGDRERDETTPATSMERKMVNDAVAYIRSLAELRGRNADWAEKAVREAASLPAHQALEMKVIDVMADDVAQLLRKIDGRTVKLATGKVTLATAQLSVERVEPGWRTRILAVLTNPNVAYVLMLLGIYGLFFELANPGAIVPGVLGGIALLLALFAFQALPINYAGLGLILLGIVFMIAEAFAPSFGALGLGGVIAFVIGSVMLIDTDVPGFQLSIMLIIGFAAASLLLLMASASFAIRAHKRPVVSGHQQLLGSEGIAAADFQGTGWIRIHGERWRAQCAVPLRAGQRVRVTELNGLLLRVEPVEESNR